MDGVVFGVVFENCFSIPENPIDKFADLNFRHYCILCRKTRVNFVHCGSIRDNARWYLVRSNTDERLYDNMCIYCLLRRAFPVEFCYKCIYAAWVVKIKFQTDYFSLNPSKPTYLINSCSLECVNNQTRKISEYPNPFALMWYRVFKRNDPTRRIRKFNRVYTFLLCWKRAFPQIPRDVVRIIANMIRNDLYITGDIPR